MKQININVESKLLDKFKQACEREGFSQSALIRKWIKEFVAKKDKTGRK